MFTALFLICNMSTGGCIQHAPAGAIYKTRNECESKASDAQDETYMAIDDPNAIVMAQCVEWGVGV